MTPEEASAFLTTLPIYSVPATFEQRALTGYAFDWELQPDGSAKLLYGSEADITPMHVVTDYARAVFNKYGESRRSEWIALCDRAQWTVNRNYSDPYGEAFGAACAVLFAGGPVPLLSFFKTQGLADEVRAFALSLIPSNKPGTVAPIVPPVEVSPPAPIAAVAPGVPTTMYDSTNPYDIPVDARMVAGYVDGWYRWPDDSWDRFPYAKKIRIVIHPANDADVLDVEWGAASPADVPAWVTRQRANGDDPVVYVNRANWQACKDACDAAGVAYPKWWVAAYGIGAVLLDGTVGTQYANEAITGQHYDLSIVAAEWAQEEDMFTREEFNRWFREQQVAEITPTIVAMKDAYDPLIAQARANGLVDATQEAHLAALDTRLAKLREV